MVVQRHFEWKKKGEEKSRKIETSSKSIFQKTQKDTMPSVHSKDSKKTDPKAILMSFFFGVANYVLLLPAELQMTQQILKGDLAQTSRMLAVRSSRRNLTYNTHTHTTHKHRSQEV